MPTGKVNNSILITCNLYEKLNLLPVEEEVKQTVNPIIFKYGNNMD